MGWGVYSIRVVGLFHKQYIAYERNRLTLEEVNYPTGEQALLAVVHALTVWRCYFEGAPEFRGHRPQGHHLPGPASHTRPPADALG